MYLTIHSTHFYLWLYGVEHVVKDHSDEKGNPLPPDGPLVSISSKVLYVHDPTDRIAHTTAFVTLIVEREILNGSIMRDRSYALSHQECEEL